MPYTTGKLKGELKVAEIRKIIRLHNKLSKITIPVKSSRDQIIKIVNDNGYTIDHKNSKFKSSRQPKDLTLKEAQDTFPVKKRVKKVEPMTKEDEVRKAKIAAPPIPPNVRGKKIKVKIGKPTGRVNVGTLNLGSIDNTPAPKKQSTPSAKPIKIKAIGKVQQAVKDIEKKTKSISFNNLNLIKLETKKKIQKAMTKPKIKKAGTILLTDLINLQSNIDNKKMFDDINQVVKNTKETLNIMIDTYKLYANQLLVEKGFSTSSNIIEKGNVNDLTFTNQTLTQEPKKAEPKKAEPKKAEPKKAKAKTPAPEPEADETSDNSALEKELEDLEQELSFMSADIKSSKKYNFKKANFTEKEVFDGSDYSSLSAVKAEFNKLKQKAKGIADDTIMDLLDSIADKIPFIADNIKGSKN